MTSGVWKGNMRKVQGLRYLTQEEKLRRKQGSRALFPVGTDSKVSGQDIA
jgi:hypothetical protein